MTRADPRFDGVDSLRALAALSVFGFHLVLYGGFAPPRWLLPYAANLNVGVSLFFVISGFVIYRPFARARLAGEPLPDLRRYALRRVARIVPAYWVALALIALWLGLGEVFTPSGLVTYFGFAQVYRSGTTAGGIPQAWSLCVEVAFYAGVALLALTLARRRPRSPGAFLRGELAACGAIVLAAVLWRLAPWYEPPRFDRPVAPATLTLPAYADQLALGMAMAVVSVWAAGRRAGRWPGPPAWTGWLLAAAAFVAAGLLTEAQTTASRGGNLLHHLLGGLVGAGILLPAVAGPPGRLRRLLTHPAARWCGVISYGFYLWHVAVLRKLTAGGALDTLGHAGYLAVALAACTALAAASWYAVERPALRLARRAERPRATLGGGAAGERALP